MHVSQPAVSQGYLCQAQKAGATGRLLSYLFLVTKPFGAFLLSLTNSANEVLPRHRRFTNGNFYFFVLLKKYEEEA